jgi:Flp pilus assembly protein TadG
MRRRDERGAAMVEAPVCIAVVLLLLMGVVTLTQVLWTHLDLAKAAKDTARYAARVEYDPSATVLSSRRHRTADEVKAWAASVAAEAGVRPQDVTVTTSDGSRLESLRTGDQVTVTIRTTVANPLYAMAASVTNTMAGLIRAGQPFPEGGVPIKAEAQTYVE